MGNEVGTFCPACGAAVEGENDYCTWCGLGLRSVEANELRALARQLADLDRELADVSARRGDVAGELSQRQWAASRAAPPRVYAAPERFTSGQRPPAGPESTVDGARTVLLWLGATLLAAAALTFTAVAWSHLGDGGRAALLLGVTLICTLLAIGLRRQLPSSAEAFTGLSIALVLIDWSALRRSGAGASWSGSAWWAVGSIVVSAFAYGLGRLVGARTARLALSVLLPVAPILLVATYATAPWNLALGLALSAAVFVGALLIVPSQFSAERTFVTVYAYGAWIVGAIVVMIATRQADTFVQALTPAFVVATLGLAPLLALRVAKFSFGLLATLLLAVPLGVLVVAMSQTFGAEGLLAWAAVVGCAEIATARWLVTRWSRPAVAAGTTFAFPGAAWALSLGIAATLGPLAWLGHPWLQSSGVVARFAYAGIDTESPLHGGWTVIVALVALVVALGVWRHVPARGVAFAVAVLAVCTAPVVGGAMIRAAFVVALATLCVVMLGAAALDRMRNQLAVLVLPAGAVALASAVGWGSVNQRSTTIGLAIVVLVAVAAWRLAVSAPVRIPLVVTASAALITWAGALALAQQTSGGAAGFAIALTAAAVLLAGVHALRNDAEGPALEIVGALGVVVGAEVAAQSSAWLAGVLTALVPVLLLAALRRERATLYGIGAVLAAVGATWAWLATADVSVVEAYTVPAAVGALAIGLIGWRTGPARSWLTLGPAIALLLGPTVALGVATDDTTRTLIAAVLAFVIVVAGAWKRLQAPLALGSVALLVLAVDTFGPAAARLPRWLPLAIVGVLLMWVGATFEGRREGARRATERLMHFG